MKTGLPQHGVVEQALDENHFRIGLDLRPCSTSRPWRPAKTGEAAPKPKGCGHRDCLPAERRSDARMRRSPRRSPGRPDAEPAKSGPTASANLAGNRQARNRSACARSAPGSGLRVGTDRQPPRCDGVTECDRNVPLPATEARHRAIGAATPRLARTSPGDRVRRSESRRRRGHSRSSRKGLCWGPPGSLVCGLHAKGTAPSIGHG